MKPRVFLLAKNDVNWSNLLSITKQALGRNITSQLDETGRKVGTPQSYVIALAAIGGDVNINSVLCNPGHILEHVFYSFIIISDYQTVTDLLEQCPLGLYTNPCTNSLHLSVISGDLNLWRSAIINGCSDICSSRVRMVLEECLNIFDSEGLGKLWSNYSRVKMPDQTLRLIEK